MSENIRRCENCGAECKTTDSFCRSCYASLKEDSANYSETINGISSSDWGSMIEKTTARYFDIFKKNEDKKVFLHFNWAACFAGIYWYFYRRMFLYGVLWLLIINILSVGAIALSGAIYYNDLQEYAKADESYVEFEHDDYGNYMIDGESVGYDTVIEVQKSNSDIESSKNAVFAKIIILSLVFVQAIAFISSLFADCLYRYSLLKKHDLELQGVHKPTGVSKPAVFACLPIVSIANQLTSLLYVFVLAGFGAAIM